MLLFHLPLEWIFAVCNITSPFYIIPVLNGSSRQICLIEYVWNGRNQYNWEIFSKCLSQHCDIYSVMLNCYWSLSPLVRERRPLSRMLSDLVLKLKTSGCTHVTANWTNLVHWKVLYMVYFLLLHWSEFLYQSLHKLNEWMTTFTVRFYRPHSWHWMQQSANATLLYRTPSAHLLFSIIFLVFVSYEVLV